MATTKAARAPLASGLVRTKPQASPSSVSEAPMDLAADSSGEQPLPDSPVTKAQDKPTEVEPKPEVKAQVVEPEPNFEPEPEPPEVRHVAIQPAQPAAALHHPSEMIPVRISAPVHARKKKADQIQLSLKLKGELLERFERARFETDLTGQEIGAEAFEIWLTHNGF